MELFFFFFEKSLLCLPMVHLFDKKESVKTVILWNFITIKNVLFYLFIFLNLIYSFDGKAKYSNHYSSLQWYIILKKSI